MAEAQLVTSELGENECIIQLTNNHQGLKLIKVDHTVTMNDWIEIYHRDIDGSPLKTTLPSSVVVMVQHRGQRAEAPRPQA